jgi:hypothetical protein
VRRNFVKGVVEDDLKVGFMIGESTAIIEKEAVVICLHCRLLASMGTSGFFFDIIELDNIQATAVFKMLLINLCHVGFENECLL